MPRPKKDAATERRVDGLLVVEELPVLSNLPVPEGRDPRDFAIRGFTKLVLEDSSVRFACADCDHVGTRGAVMKHRTRNHGVPTKPRQEKPSTAPSAAIAADLRTMSLGDVLEMGAQLQQLAIVLQNVEAQRDEYRDRCVVLENQHSRLIKALSRGGFELTEAKA